MSNPFKDIFSQCAPENAHEFLTNTALYTVGEAHGTFLGELSEEVNQLVIDAVTTAVQAVLDSANITPEWLDLARAYQATPAQSHRPAVEPCWHYDTIDHPIGLYQAMSWTFQMEQFPDLFHACGCHTDQQQAKLIETFDAMLALALIAAGVDGAWDRCYETAKAKLGGAK